MDGAIIFIFLVFAILVGSFANGRGRSWLGYFALSLVLSPLISFVIVLLLKNLKAPPDPVEVRRQEHERQLESIKALQAGPRDSVRVASTSHIADELAKLAELRDKGVLTEAEFQAQKASLLRTR